MKVNSILSNTIKPTSSVRSQNQVAFVPDLYTQDKVSFTGKVDEFNPIQQVQKSYQEEISKHRYYKTNYLEKMKNSYLLEIEKVPNADSVLDDFKGVNYYYRVDEALRKTKLGKVMDLIYETYENAVVFPTRKGRPVANAMVYVSKDKKLADDFIDATLFRSKAMKVLYPNLEDMTSHIKIAGPNNLVDFERFSDKFETFDEMSSALWDKLEAAEKKFQTTKIRTVLHVDNMEQLLNVDNSSQNIATVKDMLSSCWEDFHTVLVFGVSDPSKCDEGTLTSHRAMIKHNLDDMDITKTEISFINSHRDKLQGPVESLEKINRKIYLNYIDADETVKKLKSKCQEEVAELKKKLPKKAKKIVVDSGIVEPNTNGAVGENVESSVDSVIAKLKGMLNNSNSPKRYLPIIGGVVAGCVAAGILYKKYVKNKAEKIALQQQAPVQQQTQVKQQEIQKISQVSASPVAQTSGVFSEFQKIG